MKTKPYLLVGNGVAGTTAAEAIRQQNPKGGITILSEEDLPFYYRIRLNDFIARDIGEEKLIAQKRVLVPGAADRPADQYPDHRA